MAIQIKRTTEAIRKESDVILASGQPLYDVDTKKLYISDGVTATKLLKGTEIGLSIESGEGENSIQLPLEGEDFTYTGSDKIPHTYINKTIGNYSTNLSPKSKVEREYSLNVGYQNVLEFKEDETAGFTDGGAIIGYRNYSNSSNSFITGAWNRALTSKQVLISGYNNVINDTQSSKTGCSAIFGGINYLNGTVRNSMLVGYGLLNNGGWEYHFGQWNKPTAGVRFSIGNGKESYYFWKYNKFTFDYQTVTKEDLASFINTNETRHHPKHEECYYLYNNNDQTTISAGMLLLNIGDIREIDGTRYWIFDTEKYDLDGDTQLLELNPTTKLGVLKNSGRSNAFQVTYDGTAQLIRTDNATLGDTDLLTKNEIEAKDSAVLSEATGYTDNIANTLQSDITQLSSTKANKATTLSGYGITDAYTETQIDDKFTGLTTTKIIDGDERIKSITQTNGLLSVTTEKDCKNVSSVADITQLLNNSRAHYLIAFGAQLTLGNVIIPNYSKGYLYSTGTDAMISVVAPTGVIYNVYYNSSNNTFSGRRCLSAECTWTSGTTSVLTLEADELYILDYYGKSFIIDTNKAIGEAVYSYIAWNSESSTSHELTLYTFELDANLKLRLYKEGITSLSPSSTPSRNELNETILYKKL